MKALIGYRGFVGSNLSKTIKFQKFFNSENIDKIKLYDFTEVYCAAPHSVKYWANKNPKKDKEIILKLIKNLKEVKCKKFIHISTLDVYPKNLNLDESYKVYKSKTNNYGENRKLLEKFIITHFKNHLIIRLPALFGINLRKNLMFDLLNNEKIRVNRNSVFQWYNLEYLGKHIKLLNKTKIKSINLVSEPLSFKELILFLENKKLFSLIKLNFFNSKVLKYNFFTIYASYFRKKGNYIFSKREILNQIYNYVIKYREFNKL